MLVLIVTLVAYQALTPRPLLTIRRMLTNTIAVSGIVIALFAAAASVSATALTASLLMGRYSALHVGLLYLPELGGAIITAFALGVLLPRKGLTICRSRGWRFWRPGSSCSGFSFRRRRPRARRLGPDRHRSRCDGRPGAVCCRVLTPSASLQRVFAIVELLRAVAAFMIAPVFAHFAATVGGSPATGTGIALWIGLGLAVGGALIAVSLYLLGGARPQAPDFKAFLGGTDAAWHAPPLLAAVRGRRRLGTLADEAA